MKNTHPHHPFAKFRYALLGATVWAPLSGCNETHEETKKTAVIEQIVEADVMVVEPVNWPTTVRCQGSLMADETTTVSAKVGGRVSAVLFEIGDLASAGQILVEIDSEEYQLQAEQADAQLSQARAAVGLKPDDPLDGLNPDNAPPVREAKAVLDEATKALARINSLAGSDVVTENDLELAIAAERVAAARLASAQNAVREKIALIRVQMAQRGLAHQRLNDTRVPSPFEGYIQSKNVAIGAFVQAGQPLLTLVRNQKLRFRASVPERYAHQLKVGQRVDVRFDLSNQVREGTVSRISPNLDPMNRSLGFEVDLDNADQSLRSGLFGEATIEIAPEAKSLAIPTNTLQRFAGVDKVWKVVDGKVKEQVVLVGSARDGWVEIQKGIQSGDILVQDSEKGKPGKWLPVAEKKTSAPPANKLPEQHDGTKGDT
ncbi:Multidrug resistance protein MdtA precursor [Pirellula sp. SH-Sr6A]|uniref:efflux RND transporter periplasmic adaptor subunit n=1 Tax=Pirellula sp. SH-Sr6A TaxID=1632865 RepID=UPI00078B7F7B|nr:efflux RND transporter periplasmic adaptor subunit [Pirellula sp. SH-Sr6A]AMV35179.1 Multidrug resistance protein MdtA precursor [Pirellula sp. SH-Sr6A]